MIHFKERFRFLSLFLICTFTLLLFREVIFVQVAYGKESPTQLLNNGIEQYNNAEFELAVEWLEQAVSAGLNKKSERIAAHKYYAFSLIALGETEKAKAEFQKVLDIDAGFQLPISESPKLINVFKLAQAEWVPKDSESPVIDFTAPAAVDEKTPLTLTARITDSSELKSVELYYKSSTAAEFTALTMKAGPGESFSAVIPAEEVSIEGLDVYISATDAAGNPPAIAGKGREPITIKVNMVDTDPPVIEHEPVTLTQEKTKIEIRANIIDRSGVAAAKLFYRAAGETRFEQKELKHRGENTYIAEIPEKQVTVDGLEYYIEAGDRAKNSPAFIGSEKQPLTVRVTMLDEQSPVIKHKSPKQIPEKTPLEVMAEITDRSGIAYSLLYYKNERQKGFNKIEMRVSGDRQFSGTVPADAVIPEKISYYIEAVDKAGNAPAFQGTDKKPVEIKVTLVDTEPPKIWHDAVAKTRQGEKIEIRAAVSDNVGVDKVTLFYKDLSAKEYKAQKMKKTSGDMYTTVIKAEKENIEYYISAEDGSANAPAFWRSADKPQTITVKAQEPVTLADTKPAKQDETKPEPEKPDKKPAKEPQIKDKKGGFPWLWVGLGLVAVGGGAAVALGMGGETENPPANGYLQIDIPKNP